MDFESHSGLSELAHLAGDRHADRGRRTSTASKLKVPNWITFPMIVSGWVFNTAMFGWEGLG